MHRSRTRVGIAFLSGMLLLAVLSCAGDPTGTAGGSHGSSDQGTIDPGGQTDFMIGSTTVGDAAGALVDVWAHNLIVEADSIVSFDLVVINRSKDVLRGPVLFNIINISPEEVTVWNPALLRYGSTAQYDLSDKLGDDGQLDPGEQTEPVRIRFMMPRPTSFAIGFRVTAFTRTLIAGVVFQDFDRDGNYDPSQDIGVPNITVALKSQQGNHLAPDILLTVTTDSRGRYGFSRMLNPGVYTLEVRVPVGWASTSPNPLIVTLLQKPDGSIEPIDGVNFGLFDPNPPETMVLYSTLMGDGIEGVDEVDDTFPNPPSTMNHKYVMYISRPYFFRPTPFYIQQAHAFVNGDSTYSFQCDLTRWSNGCELSVPVGCVQIPTELIVEGENKIRLIVESNFSAALGFAIVRVPEDHPLETCVLISHPEFEQ